MRVERDECYFNEDLQPKIDKRVADGWELVNVVPSAAYSGLHIFYWKKTA
jgi:hypothetical protein